MAEESGPDGQRSPLTPSHIVLSEPGEEYLRQMQASAATAVERLAITTQELDESRTAQADSFKERDVALQQASDLGALVATLELSNEEYAKRCAAFEAENTQLKSQVALRIILKRAF